MDEKLLKERDTLLEILTGNDIRPSQIHSTRNEGDACFIFYSEDGENFWLELRKL
jgi:hypothetical protein